MTECLYVRDARKKVRRAWDPHMADPTVAACRSGSPVVCVACLPRLTTTTPNGAPPA